MLKCLAKGVALDDLSLEEFREESPVFDEDIYEAISMKNCVDKRLTKGAPGRKAMEEEIRESRDYLEKTGVFA